MQYVKLIPFLIPYVIEIKWIYNLFGIVFSWLRNSGKTSTSDVFLTYSRILEVIEDSDEEIELDSNEA